MPASHSPARRPFFAAAVLALALIAAPARAGDAVSASELESFLGLSTGALDGIGGPAFNGSGLRTSFTAAAGDVLTFQFNFLTNEDPSLLGDLINDFAFVSLNGADPMVIAEVATTPFTASSSSFSMESGLLSFSTTLVSAGIYQLGMGVVNVVDEMLPSALLLDAFQLNGLGLPGGDFEPGSQGFESIGAFSMVGGEFGPTPDGRFQGFLSSGTTAVPEPAGVISLLVGTVGVATCAACRGRETPTRE
ncbi:hypothetical protein [Planctomyces sp. SH-PL62]|uniref:hypothetical protein n=1 Tax=Planctomyces sp. SH-PL62 TaxID=1636152 RepID=UPI00078BAEC5|nr:hypothetical protein [Planctomyces sp. SH-PL62]AMV39921.1 hypothetical protein VT85_20985 [Planctomyces sp. SH-PL62]